MLIVAALTTLAACGALPAKPAAASSPSASRPVARTYATTSFKVALTVDVDPLLKSPPNPDSPGLLSWDAVASTSEKVRFLTPLEVYPPGKSSPQPPAANYLEYLQGQAASGATFSKTSMIAVAGHPTTLMTAGTANSLDGSLGCPILGADQSDGCFGLQPEYSLRIAVIDMGAGRSLLAWARTDVAAPDDAFVSMFERMLASVQFK